MHIHFEHYTSIIMSTLLDVNIIKSIIYLVWL